MNELKIPKGFELFGQNIKVTLDELRCKDIDCLGACNESINEILYTTKNQSGYDRTSDCITQTFFHELVHMILLKMGENKLSGDEKFVDLFSGLLHQYAKTVKY